MNTQLVKVGSQVNWKYVGLGALVLTLILYIYFTGKKAGRMGKPNIVKLPKDIELPTDANGNVIEDPVIKGEEIRAIAIALYEDMEDTPFTGHDYEPYLQWNRLNNAGFVAVYNDFNTQYHSMDEGTLREWIKSQYYAMDGGLIDDVILPRMLALNLV